MTKTRSMCNVCYRTIPADRIDLGDSIRLVKTCPEHGIQEAVREPNGAFDRWMRNVAFDAAAVDARPKATMINTTDRCNLACPNCYHQPDAGPDPTIADVVAVARQATRPIICMLGAEATVRSDLPELIAALRAETGKKVALYTNGLRLSNPAYVARLVEAGLASAAISLHTPAYVGTDLFDRKLKAIANLRHSALRLWHVAFSIQRPSDVGEALDVARSLDLPEQTHIRMRVTGAIGSDQGTSMALSDLVAAFHQALLARGLRGQAMKGSHPYMLIIQVDGRNFFLLRWPSVEEVDLDDLECCPPRALLVPEEGEQPLIQQGLLFAHRRAGRSVGLHGGAA